jgi:uncharacterized DUF497 family protein
MRYEWEEAKNLRNQRKHDGISFELAALVFEDERCLVYADRIDSKTKGTTLACDWRRSD